MATVRVFNIQMDIDAHTLPICYLVIYHISWSERGVDSGTMTHVCVFRKLPLTDIYVYLVKGLIDIICFLNILLLQIFSYKDIRFLLQHVLSSFTITLTSSIWICVSLWDLSLSLFFFSCHSFKIQVSK